MAANPQLKVINTSDETCWDRLVSVMDEPVIIFLTNGVKLSGYITERLLDGVVLTRDGISQIVLRQAMATIMPQASPAF